jgi:hypothetical protein
MRALFGSIALIVIFSIAAAAQTTPWGDPDLQGIWSNQTPVPLERPKNSLASILKFVGGAIPTSGELNGIWLETGKGKVGRNLSTSQIIDPQDGKIPFSNEGKARWRNDEGVFEVACHEGNYGLANLLSGARAQEKK